MCGDVSPNPGPVVAARNGVKDNIAGNQTSKSSRQYRAPKCEECQKTVRCNQYH